MPIVKVYGIPEFMRARSIGRESFLGHCRKELKEVIASVPELNIAPHQVSVFFVPDLCQDGMENEIAVEIELFQMPARTPDVLHRLAELVVQHIQKLFEEKLPSLKFIEALIFPFNQQEGGYSALQW